MAYKSNTTASNSIWLSTLNKHSNTLTQMSMFICWKYFLKEKKQREDLCKTFQILIHLFMHNLVKWCEIPNIFNHAARITPRMYLVSPQVVFNSAVQKHCCSAPQITSKSHTECVTLYVNADTKGLPKSQ